MGVQCVIVAFPAHTQFCLFDSLHPSRHFFSYVGLGLPGLNQYKARINVSSSKTQHIDARDAPIPQPLSLESSTLPLSHCTPILTFCSRTQHSASHESRTSDPSMAIPTLYHWATALHPEAL